MADSITLTGLTGTRAQIMAAAEAAAYDLQQKISDAFEKSRTLKGRVHTPARAYTDWKAEQGFDTRPGHRSGMLAESLRFDQLYTIAVGRGTCTVQFDIALSEVEYAQHYSDLYTPGGNLLAITKTAEREFRADVIGLLPKVQTQAKAKPAAKPEAKQKTKPPQPAKPKAVRVNIIRPPKRSALGSFLIGSNESLIREIAGRFNLVKIRRGAA